MDIVNYKLIPKKINLGPNKGETKYYAIEVNKGEITLDTLANNIAHYSTLSRVDIVAVIAALVDEVHDGLANGNIVRLGELGSFRLTIGSEGVDCKDDFKKSMINKSRVQFNPGKRIKALYKKLKFRKV